MASKLRRSVVAGLVLVATFAVFVGPARAAGGTVVGPGTVYDETDTTIVFDGSDDPHTGVARTVEISGGDNPDECNHGDEPDDGVIGLDDLPSGGCYTIQFDINDVNNGTMTLAGASGGGHPSGAEILGATVLPSGFFNIFGTLDEVNAALETLTFDPEPDYETSYPSSGDPTFIELTVKDGAGEPVAFVDDEGTELDPEVATLDLRIEQPNDPPDLSIGVQDQPVQVPAGGEVVLRNDDGVDEFADDVFLEDPDVDDDEDDDFILMVAWLDGGNGQADFSLSPSVSPDCVATLDEIILQDDLLDPGEPPEERCDVLPGPIDLSLVPADIPGSLSFTSSTQDQQAIAMLGRYNELDNNDGPAEAILSYIEFDAMPSGDCDCTITVVVSDLGNNGLPLDNLVEGVVLPVPGFDLETIDFQVRDPENDPPVVTPIPPGPTPVDELASVPVSFSVTDPDAGTGDLTITEIVVSGGTLSGAPSVPMSGSQAALSSALTGMSFTASETVADPGVGSVSVTVQDNGRGPAENLDDNQMGSGTATFTINEDGEPDIDPNPGVNDPPVLDAPAAIGTVEGSVFAFNDATIGVSDADAAADDLTMTITSTGEGTTNQEGPVTGTLAELNVLLDGLTFTPDDDADFDDEVASIEIEVNDNGHNPDSDDPADEGTDSVTIDVTIDDDDVEPEVNDPPALSAPPTIDTVEGVSFAFDDATIGVDDPDAGTDDLTLTITSSGEGATNEEGPHTGSLAELNTLLDGLTFLPDDDADLLDDTASILVEVNDNGHNPDSDDPADEGTDSLTINVAIDDDDVEPPEVNDPPVLTAPAGIATVEGTVFELDDATIGVDDPDAATDELTLTITSTGEGTTNAEGSQSGTLAQLNAVLDGLTFTPDDDADFADGVASIELLVNDNGHNPDSDEPADEGTDSATIDVTIDDDDVEPPDVNDPPVITAPASGSVLEGSVLGFDALTIGVDDPDAGTDDLTMTITPTGGTTNADGATTGTLTELNVVLDALEFTAPQDPDFANEVGSIVIEVNDNGHNPDSDDPADEGTDSATVDLTIVDDDEPPEVNDPPVLTAPPSFSVTEGLSFGFTPAAIGVDDPDAGADDLTMTITSTGDGTTNAEGVHTGTLAELEAVLDALSFQTVQDVDTVDDAASILIEVNDNGHNPDSDDPADEGTDSATIEVTILDDDLPPDPNDPPTLTAPGAQSVEAGGTIAFVGGLRIVVDDPDAGSADLALHLEATGGTLVPATADVTGDLTELQAFLDSLVFTAGSTPGAASVTVTVDDQGNTGTGGPLTASATIDITITEGEDPPESTTTTTTTPGSTTTTAPGSTTTTAPAVDAGSVTQGSGTTTTSGALPRTGASVTALVVAGAVLLLAGAIVVVGVRRRRSS